MKKILVTMDGIPAFNVEVTRNTQIRNVKMVLDNYLKDKDVKNYNFQWNINEEIQLPIFFTQQYDNLTLESVFKVIDNSKIEITSKYFRAEDEEVAKIFREQLNNGIATFKVLDNGSQPFRVTVKKEGIKLTVTLSDSTTEGIEGEIFPREDDFKNFSMTIENVDMIWLGSGSYENYFDRSHEHFLGNTALLIKGNTCISIASNISTFTLKKNEYVVRYISTVGNSAVPYGYISTNRGYYALASFNCTNGFLPSKYVKNEEELNLSCWIKDEYPFTMMEKIKSLTILVPGT